MQKITPFLWFKDNAEEAIDFYLSVFKDSKILSVSRYGDAGPGPKGSFMVGTFQIEGQKFMALNGGPIYSFTNAVSFVVNCDTQEEVDHYWKKLTEGGKEIECGWLTDRYGLSWQIVPTAFGELMSDPDPVKTNRVMQAMLHMTKMNIRGLKDAYDGKE